MRDLDTLALYDALPPEEQAAVAAALRDQPALAEAFARWRSLRADVRAELARDLPDRALLVLYALADDDLLSADEQAHLEAARPQIEAALARHPGLVAAVRRIRADRDAFEAAWAEAARVEADPVPTRPAATRTEARPEARPAADRAPARRARPLRWAARAAALVAVVAFAAILTTVLLRDAGWETVTAAERQTVAFGDGSTVDLDAGARLMVPEDGDARRARLLAGNALFRVVRDEARPFEVTTPNAEVTVLGTTFGVAATDVETEVVLVSGAVALAPRATPDAAVVLAPGEQSRVLALDAPTAPAPADLRALGWTGSVFAHDATVGEVARHLGDVFGTPVAVDPALAGERISDGEYGADGLEDALGKLARALGARAVPDGAGFRIEG